MAFNRVKVNITVLYYHHLKWYNKNFNDAWSLSRSKNKLLI
jgi:hypothetical protein